MPSDIHPSNFLRATGEMGTSSELKKNSKQEKHGNTVKQRAISPQASRSSKYTEKINVKNPARSSYNDLHREQKQDRDGKKFVRAKSSANRQRQFDQVSTSKDELVKYMSNLPGYLQRAERVENLQEKALNFGVLDWAQLEKWKHKQKQIPTRGSDKAVISIHDFSSNATNGSSTLSTTTHSKTSVERQSLSRYDLDASESRGSDKAVISIYDFSSKVTNGSSHKAGHPQAAKSSVKNVKRFQDFETASKSNMDGQKKVPSSYKSSGGNASDIMLDKEKRKDSDNKIPTEMEKFSTNSRTSGVLPCQNHNGSDWDGEAKKSVEKLEEADIKRKGRDPKIIPERKGLHRKLRSFGVSLGSKEMLSSGSGEIRKRVEELQQPDIDLTNGCSSGEHKNVVLLRPKEFLKKEFSEVVQPSRPKHSKEKLLEAQGSTLSDTFSCKVVHSAGLSSGIPFSCPLPSGAVVSARSSMEPRSLIDTRGNDISSVASHSSQCSNKAAVRLSKWRDAKKNNLDRELTKPDIDAVKTSDEETAVLATTNARNPSPNRRFSFSLGRLGRSFSFKEGSSVSQLSSSYVSIKSGPIRSETSASLDNSYGDKSNVHHRAKASPLRRLLDPILKYRVANPVNSAETVHPLKESWDSFGSGPISFSHILQNRKHDESTIQALLQLTVTNGLPFYTFMVENDTKVLRATMKNLTSSGKDDSGRNYTFYLVNELKKKSSGWISQVSKRDSCGYVYNVIGQMKVSSSFFTDLSGHYSSNNQYVVRESVLFSVELQKEDQESPKFKRNRELAAVIVKIPSENLSHDGMEGAKDLMEKLCIKCLPEDRFSCNSKETEDSDSIKVIIPGGVHSSPNKGEPSPLIDRWRSGGSCDCGGWDVGCKLRVLSSNNRCSKIHDSCKANPIPDDIELFVQGEAQKSKPFFSLTPLKDGLYSIEFDASISFLQSFFICVALLSCKKQADSYETTIMTEAKGFRESIVNLNGGTQGKATSKYAPSPPPSPVGRV